MKKILGILGCAVIALGLLVGCKDAKADGLLHVGILQGIEHEALNQARLGFIDGLKENGYGEDKVTIDYKNALGTDADLKTFASSLLRSADLTLGIGTGAAQTLLASSGSTNNTNPIMFTACTDPVGANLVSSLEVPGGHVSGTHDMNPIKEQIALITEVLGKTPKAVGILYTASEQNSEVQANIAKDALKEAGIDAKVLTINQASDIQMTVRELAKSVEAIYIPTDNLLAANMALVSQVATEEKVITCVGCKEMVDDGGSITLSINYYELGKLTGKMASQVLDGEDISKMSVSSLSLNECEIAINEENLKAIGINYTK